MYGRKGERGKALREGFIPLMRLTGRSMRGMFNRS